MGVVALIAHAFGAAICAEPTREFSDLIAHVAILGVESSRTDFIGELEPIFLAINGKTTLSPFLIVSTASPTSTTTRRF
jgi:hypothetical protein